MSYRKKSREKQQPPVERLLYRPAEAAQAMSVSVSRMYELIHSGIVPSVRLDGTIRVPVEALRELVEYKDSEPKTECP